MHRGICVLKQLARGEPLSSAKLLYLRGMREKKYNNDYFSPYVFTFQLVKLFKYLFVETNMFET